MSEYRIQSETLEGIADAIREKTGDSALIAPEDMATEIASISGGGEEQLGFRTATITSAVTADTLTVDMGEPWASNLVGVFSAIDFSWPTTSTSGGAHRVQGAYFTNSYHNGHYSVGYKADGARDWWTNDSGLSSNSSAGTVTLNKGVEAGTTYKICLIVNEVS